MSDFEALPADDNRDHIEPDARAPGPLPIEPDGRTATDPGLLREADSLDRQAEMIGRACLHLDEHDRGPGSDDQIDLAMLTTEIPLKRLVTEPVQVLLGRILAGQPKRRSRVHKDKLVRRCDRKDRSGGLIVE